MDQPQSNNIKLGIPLMVMTTFVFAVQDGISRHLAEQYNVITIVMIRYWFFGAFVFLINSPFKYGFKTRVKSKQPLLQIFRGALLACEVCVMVLAFTKLGLVQSHAIFAFYPLIVLVLSGLFLREKIIPQIWVAILSGFIGVIILLNPGSAVFNVSSLIPFCSAILFALYNVLTRYAARTDSPETSYFWTGVSGAIFITFFGLFFWHPPTGTDWCWMGLLCVTGALGHYLLIKTLDIAQASSVQPYAYLQLIFATSFGITFFSETITIQILIGTAIVIISGVYTFVISANK